LHMEFDLHNTVKCTRLKTNKSVDIPTPRVTSS